MWTMTEEDRANARGGVNSPAARQAQAEWAARAAKRKEAARRRNMRRAKVEEKMRAMAE